MRVLLTRLSALGDIVHTWPLASLLARELPGIEIHWLVERHFLPLVETHGAVAGTISVATRCWRKEYLSAATRQQAASVARRLRELSFEVALDPQGLVKSAIWAKVAGVPTRAGLERRHRRERAAGLFYTETVSPLPGATHVVDINLSFAGVLGVTPALGVAPDGRFLLAAGNGPRLAAGSTVVLPATGVPGKAWPPRCWAQLAAALARAGRPVCVAWGPGERQLAEAIASEAGPGVETAPPTSIVELAHLLSSAQVVVGGDTGTVHLAASLGVPTVAIFLATDPLRNRPRGDHVAVVSAARTGTRHGRARTGVAREVGVDEVLAVVHGLAP